MPRRTREQSLEIREAILDAAERVIAKYGIEKTTMSRVAHASGASRGAIYWHFQDKDALYEAVAERIMAPPDTASRTGTDQEVANPVGDLRNLLYDILRRIARDPSAWHLIEARSIKSVIARRIGHAPVRHGADINKWMIQIKRLLMQAKQKGLVAHALDTDALTLGLWIIVDGLVRAWISDRVGFDLLQQAECLIEPYLSGLKSGAVTADPFGCVNETGSDVTGRPAGSGCAASCIL